MIQLYYFPTPNGHKVTLFLEEVGLPYEIHTIDITKGDQFKEEFLRISPNNKIPAIVDGEIRLFESGAILEYLADQTGRFLPPAGRPERYEVLKWLYWQVGGLGPMLGQLNHFAIYTTEKIPYAIERYTNEGHRLLRVLDTQLKGREFVAGDYSIADMAIYPWVASCERAGIKLGDFAQVTAWTQRIAARPAVQRAYKIADHYQKADLTSPEVRKVLFGQR